MKRWLSMLLALCMVWTMVVPAAWADTTSTLIASGVCGKNLNWTLDNDWTLTISGTGDMASYSASPTTVPWYSNRDKIKSVVLTPGITSIGDIAFSECGALSSVTIPDGVTTIGGGAFHGCYSLTSVTIPDSVTSIGTAAFSSCSLSSITLPSGLTSISIHTFSHCKALTNISIPDSVTSIDAGAFENCVNLSNVVLSNNVTSIGEFVFSGCVNLSSVTIPDSITSISDRVFYNCAELADIYYIGTQEQWNAITIGTYNTPLASANIHCLMSAPTPVPTNVLTPSNTPIPTSTFTPTLTNTPTPTLVPLSDSPVASGTCGDNLVWTLDENGLLTISGTGRMADYFYTSCAPWYDNRSEIKSVVLDSGVINISNHAFFGCDVLNSIIIPDGVISIGDYAFFRCDALSSVTIPNSVTSIGIRAFFDCCALTNITIPNSVVSIGEEALRSCDNLISIEVGAENGQFSSETGILFNKDLIILRAGLKPPIPFLTVLAVSMMLHSRIAS